MLSPVASRAALYFVPAKNEVLSSDGLTVNIVNQIHKWIQRFKTIKPFVINSVDPFGIPLLVTRYLIFSFYEQVLVYSLLVGAQQPPSTDVP